MTEESPGKDAGPDEAGAGVALRAALDRIPAEPGCYLFKNEAGEVQENFVKAVPVEVVIDTTGCVEAFAGGLAFGYLKTGDFLRAARYANAMGAQRCTGSDIAIFKSLEETDLQIARCYPP